MIFWDSREATRPLLTTMFNDRHAFFAPDKEPCNKVELTVAQQAAITTPDSVVQAWSDAFVRWYWPAPTR